MSNSDFINARGESVRGALRAVNTQALKIANIEYAKNSQATYSSQAKTIYGVQPNPALADNKTSFTTRKKLAIAASLLLALAIILTATLAWQSFKANALNESLGAPGPAGGRLHDDYEDIGQTDGIDNWSAGKSANKDIYVENYESKDNKGRDIFVRVKLYEYMEIGPGAKERPLLGDGSSNPAYATREVTPLIENSIREDFSTWTARLMGADIASDQFKSRFDFTYGGQKTYMPTFNKDYNSHETDIKGKAIDPNLLDTNEVQNTTEIGEQSSYSKDAGTHDYFETEKTWDAKEKFWDKTLTGTGTTTNPQGDHCITTDTVTHTAKLSESAKVITMEEWKLTPYDGRPGNFWVIDTDGWAYWANPLSPDNATGLLIDSITLLGEPDDMWYYAIYVKSEMATATDWMNTSEGLGFYSDALEAPSKDATGLLNIITGHLPKVKGVYLGKTIAAVGIGDTLTLTANVVTENTNDETYQEVTWSIAPSAGSRFAGGIFSPANEDADKWYMIRATSTKNTNMYTECKVYVPKTNQGVLTGKDGNSYVYFIGSDDNTYQRVYTNGTLGQIVCPQEVGRPGALTDRTNVVVIGGIHYLDEGNNRYYNVGVDGKLGTADDELVHDDNGSMKPVEDKVNLTITPSPSEVTKGKTLVLSAAATLNGVSQDTSVITWKLVGTYFAGTTITGTGANATLAADENESTDTIVVRATYPGNAGLSKDITVSICPAMWIDTTP